MVGKTVHFERFSGYQCASVNNASMKKRDAEDDPPSLCSNADSRTRDPPVPLNAPPAETVHVDSPVAAFASSQQCPRHPTCIRPARHPGFCKRVPAPAVQKTAPSGARSKTGDMFSGKLGHAPVTPPEQPPGGPAGQAAYNFTKGQHSGYQSAGSNCALSLLGPGGSSGIVATKASRIGRLVASGGLKSRASMMPPTSFELSPTPGANAGGSLRRVQSAVFTSHSNLAVGGSWRKGIPRQAVGFKRSASQIFGEPVCYKCGEGASGKSPLVPPGELFGHYSFDCFCSPPSSFISSLVRESPSPIYPWRASSPSCQAARA
ncbi:hypothetical protein CYMTET_26612 [Cymbomonas tetramitiformis]|uniref:Uncharacterized protein n=1 Tax=Cymbomonas tetramitiformis TaxID=36881 RepID=A0AAE0FRI5_9CHLO|nr:hypothetical protein CYMTET_26612 [Cymbomonas tetramitiformis]